jgi:hypothetical protein
MGKPRLVNWKECEERGEVEGLLLTLTSAYRKLAPLSGQGPAVALEQAVQNTVGFKRLDRLVRTTDGYIWAIAVEFRAGFDKRGRIKILLPYAKKQAGWLTSLEQCISVHQRGAVETHDVAIALRNLLIRLEHTPLTKVEEEILPPEEVKS